MSKKLTLTDVKELCVKSVKESITLFTESGWYEDNPEDFKRDMEFEDKIRECKDMNDIVNLYDEVSHFLEIILVGYENS